MELSVLTVWAVFINIILFEKSKTRIIVHLEEGRWNKNEDEDGEKNGNERGGEQYTNF